MWAMLADNTLSMTVKYCRALANIQAWWKGLESDFSGLQWSQDVIRGTDTRHIVHTHSKTGHAIWSFSHTVLRQASSYSCSFFCGLWIQLQNLVTSGISPTAFVRWTRNSPRLCIPRVSSPSSIALCYQFMARVVSFWILNTCLFRACIQLKHGTNMAAFIDCV